MLRCLNDIFDHIREKQKGREWLISGLESQSAENTSDHHDDACFSLQWNLPATVASLNMAVSDFWILIWFSKGFPGSKKILAFLVDEKHTLTQTC